jgi:translation initiation factor 4A
MPIVEKHDVIVQAQSGTGKTGTFVIGSLQRIDPKILGPQVLTLSHTRELAQQTTEVYKELGRYLDYNYISCIGGNKISDTVSLLKENKPSVIIGTPGRLLHMIEEEILDAQNIQVVIIDEVDELLKDNFTEQFCPIMEAVNQKAQICTLSATMPKSIHEIITKFSRDPVNILVKKEQLTLSGIKQYYVNAEEDKYKYEILCDLYSKITIGKSIIYVNTKKRAEILKNCLDQDKFTASIIHGALESDQRKDIMSQFKTGNIRILISTDLTARGIDVKQVSLVINYDIPTDKETYIHRIGRSGRYGKLGTAINFSTKYDHVLLLELEKHYQTQIESLPEVISL